MVSAIANNVDIVHINNKNKFLKLWNKVEHFVNITILAVSY